MIVLLKVYRIWCDEWENEMLFLFWILFYFFLVFFFSFFLQFFFAGKKLVTKSQVTHFSE